MSISSPSLRYTRTAIVILLAMFVVLLGAAAKHSQFDGPPQHGYLAKIVKMECARANVAPSPELAQELPPSIPHFSTLAVKESTSLAPTSHCFSAVCLSSPPLRT